MYTSGKCPVVKILEIVNNCIVMMYSQSPLMIRFVDKTGQRLAGTEFVTPLHSYVVPSPNLLHLYRNEFLKLIEIGAQRPLSMSTS